MKSKQGTSGQLIAAIVILALGVLLACVLGPGGIWGVNGLRM